VGSRSGWTASNSPIPGDPKAMAELGLKILPPAT
jgi:hypothetical protein